MKPAILGLILACGLLAQDQHVAWKLSLEPPSAPPGAKVLLRMAGRIDEGWHLYSMSTPAAIPTKIQLAPNPAIAKIRPLQPKPKRSFDANFNSDTETYEGDVAFLLELELAEGRSRRPHRALRLRPLPDLQSQHVRAVQVDRQRDPHRGPGRRIHRHRHSRRLLQNRLRPRRPHPHPPPPPSPKASSPFSPWPSASDSPPSSPLASSP